MGIKALIKNFIDVGSKAEPINDKSDYNRVKEWVKKVRVLYSIFSVIALVLIVLLPFIGRLFEMPTFLAYTIAPAMIMLTCWGYATLILYLPQVLKTVIKTGSMGFKVGENIETTHVNVTHEYGNTYKVSSHTENKGCLFAIIGGFIGFFVWTFFCVYIGPFITFNKLKNSMKKLKEYSAE